MKNFNLVSTVLAVIIAILSVFFNTAQAQVVVQEHTVEDMSITVDTAMSLADHSGEQTSLRDALIYYYWGIDAHEFVHLYGSKEYYAVTNICIHAEYKIHRMDYTGSAEDNLYILHAKRVVKYIKPIEKKVVKTFFTEGNNHYKVVDTLIVSDLLDTSIVSTDTTQIYIDFEEIEEKDTVSSRDDFEYSNWIKKPIRKIRDTTRLKPIQFQKK